MLLGGNRTSLEGLLAHYPDASADKLLHVDAEAFLTHYDRLYRHMRFFEISRDGTVYCHVGVRAFRV